MGSSSDLWTGIVQFLIVYSLASSTGAKVKEKLIFVGPLVSGRVGVLIMGVLGVICGFANRVRGGWRPVGIIYGDTFARLLHSITVSLGMYIFSWKQNAAGLGGVIRLSRPLVWGGMLL